MAITRSAKKAKRASERKRVFNLRRKKDLREAIKEASRLVLAKDTRGMETFLPKLHQSVDKAVKRGIMKKNAAARIKSRIATSGRVAA